MAFWAHDKLPPQSILIFQGFGSKTKLVLGIGPSPMKYINFHVVHLLQPTSMYSWCFLALVLAQKCNNQALGHGLPGVHSFSGPTTPVAGYSFAHLFPYLSMCFSTIYLKISDDWTKGNWKTWKVRTGKGTQTEKCPYSLYVIEIKVCMHTLNLDCWVALSHLWGLSFKIMANNLKRVTETPDHRGSRLGDRMEGWKANMYSYLLCCLYFHYGKEA